MTVADRNPKTLGGLLQESMDARLADVHTAMPGRVEAYDLAEQTVDVTPLIKRVVFDLDGNEIVEELPKIFAVPVAFPRAGKAFMSFPLAKGDTVLLVFCERSIDQWQTKGGVQDPGDLGTHGLGYAVAYPGIYDATQKLTAAHADNIVIGFDDGKVIHVKSATIALGVENPSDNMALSGLVKTELDGIKTDIDAIKAQANSHVHPTGVGPSGVAVPVLVTTYSPAEPKSAVVESE